MLLLLLIDRNKRKEKHNNDIMSRGYHNGQMMQPNNMQQPGQIPVQMSLGTPKSNQQQGGFGSRGMPMQQLGNMNPNMQIKGIRNYLQN